MYKLVYFVRIFQPYFAIPLKIISFNQQRIHIVINRLMRFVFLFLSATDKKEAEQYEY